MEELVKNLIEVDKKLKQSKTHIVISPKTYAQLFEDIGPNAKITLHVEPLKPGHKRKVV